MANPALSPADMNNISLELMSKMHLFGMAEAFKESLNSTFPETMTPDSFLSWLLTSEWDYRSEQTIQRLIKGAGFRYKALLEEVDYGINRNLDRNQLERLASLEFVKEGKNIFFTGPSGTGKSFLAIALGYEACKNGVRTYYANAPKLFGHLKVAKAKNTLELEMKKIEKCPLLILDDLFLGGVDAKDRSFLMEIIEDRYNRKSTIIASQFPVDAWYDEIGDPTIADAILDRLVHTAHRVELTGESVRKQMNKK